MDGHSVSAGACRGRAQVLTKSSARLPPTIRRSVGVGHPSAAPSETGPGPATIAAFARVQACRDDMYEIFLALGDGSAPPDSALRRLHHAYVEALAQGQLTGGAEGCVWTWDPGSGLLAPCGPSSPR